MALQGRALQKICHDILRMNILGTSRKRAPTQLKLAHQKHTTSVSNNGSSKTVPPLPFASLQTNCLRKQSSLDTSERRKADHTDSFLDITAEFSSLTLASTRAGRMATNINELRLASWPNKEVSEYICPSEKLSTLPDLVILEQTPNTVSYDLPQIPSLIPLVIDTPDRPGQSEISEPANSQRNTPKEARLIMKIRRKKMKRHLLKKFRKRMAFTLRKIRREQRKKKEAVFQARLASIKAWGDNFDAKEWAQEELNKARLGGFYINVLERKK